MAKKIKFQSKKGLSANFAAGSDVFIQYICLHDNYGVLNTPAPAPHLSGENLYWEIHWQAAKQFAEKCEEIDSQVFDTPGNMNKEASASSKSRFVKEELSYTLYVTAAEMCLNTVISVEHFANNLFQYLADKPVGFHDMVTEEKLKIAVSKLLNIDLKKDNNYANDFMKILKIRHEISHPNKIFDYACLSLDGRWDDVPLNWFLSGRGVKAFENWKTSYEDLQEKFVAYLNKLPKKEFSVHNVQRGIGFNHDLKKKKL